MTEGNFRVIASDLLSTWQTRLRLDHWTIDTEFNADIDPSANAMIHVWGARNFATLKFPKEANEYEPETLELCIIHELVHLHLCRIHETVERMCSWQSTEFQNLIITEVINKVELATDALSTAIQEIASTLKEGNNG